jgi:hypothetical protein
MGAVVVGNMAKLLDLGDEALYNLSSQLPLPLHDEPQESGREVEMPTIPRDELELANIQGYDQRWHQARALELIHLVS